MKKTILLFLGAGVSCFGQIQPLAPQFNHQSHYYHPAPRAPVVSPAPAFRPIPQIPVQQPIYIQVNRPALRPAYPAAPQITTGTIRQGSTVVPVTVTR